MWAYLIVGWLRELAYVDTRTRVQVGFRPPLPTPLAGATPSKGPSAATSAIMTPEDCDTPLLRLSQKYDEISSSISKFSASAVGARGALSSSSSSSITWKTFIVKNSLGQRRQYWRFYRWTRAHTRNSYKSSISYTFFLQVDEQFISSSDFC